MNAHSFGFAFGCLLASSKYTIYCTCMMTIAGNGVHTKQLYAMMSDVRMANGYTIFVFCVCVCVPKTIVKMFVYRLMYALPFSHSQLELHTDISHTQPHTYDNTTRAQAQQGQQFIR